MIATSFAPRWEARSRPERDCTCNSIHDVNARRGEVLLPRNDDVVAAIERLADGLVGLAPHDYGFAERQLAEALEVGRHAPRQLAVAADHAVLRNRDDERDDHVRWLTGMRSSGT